MSKPNGTADSRPEHIQVGVRVRPLTPSEAQSGESVAWRVDGAVITQTDTAAKKAGKVPDFRFQHVFGPGAKTSAVYEELVAPIVQDSLRGINGAVCCYGQTSAGKTYTCQGNDSEPGIIPLALRDIFRSIEEVPSRQFVLKFSYIEIYNEHVFDLLTGSDDNLSVQEDRERVTIKGLSEVVLSSEEQAFELMESSQANRKVSRTQMNEHSSRSHVIFRISIESKANDADTAMKSTKLVSQLNFVDLAGSERIARAGASGVLFKEGTAINKSLLFLGIVISALSRGLSHAPFRDSRLTLILKNCLGGNSRTAFIQCITPARSCSEESISTLRIASRIGNVTNVALVNEIPCDGSPTNGERRSESERMASELLLKQQDLSRHNRLLQIQLHQYKTLYMRKQGEHAEQQETADRIVQLESEVQALNMQIDDISADKAFLEDSNAQLIDRVTELETEVAEAWHSAQLLNDLSSGTAQSRWLRLSHHDSVEQLEQDLYSALRTVIAYRERQVEYTR
ncbi:unnamed protein product (mitochondrion) [Plasmodiophora brassicae]|uniref:Kinesin-like protein n=1 Tax=Plasmodiophora brassicae TaxID=37360 RepID=A0A3P3Y3Q4_PLABS|nr:unnamed protein product [Plasmodiophora brassicae]